MAHTKKAKWVRVRATEDLLYTINTRRTRGLCTNSTGARRVGHCSGFPPSFREQFFRSFRYFYCRLVSLLCTRLKQNTPDELGVYDVLVSKVMSLV